MKIIVSPEARDDLRATYTYYGVERHQRRVVQQGLLDLLVGRHNILEALGLARAGLRGNARTMNCPQ